MQIHMDEHGIEWAVTSSGMTRMFRRRTLWIRFSAWVRRAWKVVRP